jgi:hypothetical protein
MARKRLELDAKYKVPILLKATELAKNRPTDLVAYCDTWTKDLSNSQKSCFTADDCRMDVSAS